MDSTEYYRIDLISTKSIAGTGFSVGTAGVMFAPSIYGIALSPDGSFHLQLRIQVDQLPPPPTGSQFVAWVTTPSIDQIQRLGDLDPRGHLVGTVQWNKFIVVITLESASATGPTWAGPIILRGMARSGKMHTMAGHGPFEQERCATYGY